MILTNVGLGRTMAVSLAVALLALVGCSSAATAESCDEIQKACLSAGKCLDSHNAGSTAGGGSYNGGVSGGGSDEASCDISCVACDAPATGANGAAPAKQDGGSGTTSGGTGAPNQSTPPPAGEPSQPALLVCPSGAGLVCPQGYSTRAMAFNTVCAPDCLLVQSLCLRDDLSAVVVRDDVACPLGHHEVIRGANDCPRIPKLGGAHDGGTIALCVVD